MNQFPQPTRPAHSYNLTPIEFPQASQHVNMNNVYSGSSIPEDRFQFDFPESLVPQPKATEEEEEEEEKKAIEDLIRVITEWYKKFPGSIRTQINWDKFNVSSNNTTEQGFQVESTTIRGHNKQLEEFKHRLERFKIRTIHINTSRGVKGPAEELEQKHERFKIRTVQLEEVAQEKVKK
ncbi:hypothetical protein REPUB_Repub02eG0226600 [Reevesia pubescens]